MWGFHYVFVNAEMCCFLAVFLGIRGRHHDDRNIPDCVGGPRHRWHLAAMNLGQVPVQHDQVGLGRTRIRSLPPQKGQRLGTIAGDVWTNPAVDDAQRFQCQVKRSGVIFRDQYIRHALAPGAGRWLYPAA